MMILLRVIYFNNIKDVLQNDNYIELCFMLLCWNNPSLKGQMLHSEGNIQHIVYQIR